MAAFVAIGCILGQGGSTIQGMRDATGSNIRIITFEKTGLIPQALQGDNMLQVSDCLMYISEIEHCLNCLLLLCTDYWTARSSAQDVGHGDSQT